MRIVRHLLFVGAAFAAAASLPTASAAQMGGGQPGETIVVNEGPMPAEAGVGQPGGCGCRSVQQPPWHGSVRGAQCGPAPACCRGSSVFQAHPFQQLPCNRPPCTTLPPCLPRLHAMCREGYLPTPVSPVQPRCHQCGAAIEGGF